MSHLSYNLTNTVIVKAYNTTMNYTEKRIG